jgi:hypothetical protein
MSITYSDGVFVALVIQHAVRVRRIILSSMACLAVQYFPHYLVNCTIFDQKKLSSIKRVF